ncbi:MAG: hypothetical protein EA401_08270 [Planctomycetota bacterium]|nr:MAG: hypothetical protein EA401_08270 [Planctomycetota bacterium]
MKYHILFTVALAASVIIFTGCNRSRISEYPDQSADTVRRVDDIRHNARDQHHMVDLESVRTANRLNFREQQIRNTHAALRQQHVNEANAEATESDA